MLFSNSVLSAKINMVTEHLAPFQIVESNTITGLSSEIVKATLKATQYSYNLSAHTWEVSYNQALKEANTCIYSLARIPSREKLFQWIGAITHSNTSFYALENKKIQISRLEDAKNYKIAVINSDVSHHFLLSKGFVENKHFYVLNNYDALLKLLEIPSRNIDLVISNEALLTYRVNHVKELLKYKKIMKIKELNLDLHLACSLKTEKAIVRKLNETMEKLEKNGTFFNIRDKWQKKLKVIP